MTGIAETVLNQKYKYWNKDNRNANFYIPWNIKFSKDPVNKHNILV